MKNYEYFFGSVFMSSDDKYKCIYI